MVNISFFEKYLLQLSIKTSRKWEQVYTIGVHTDDLIKGDHFMYKTDIHLKNEVYLSYKERKKVNFSKADIQKHIEKNFYYRIILDYELAGKRLLF